MKKDKNTVDEINRLDTAKENTSKLEDIAIKTIVIETEKQPMKISIRELWDNLNQANYVQLGSLEEKKKNEWGAEK